MVGGSKKKVQNRVAVVLRTAAMSVTNFPGRRQRQGRYLAVLIHRLMTHGQAWVDLGAAQFERKRLDSAKCEPPDARNVCPTPSTNDPSSY